MKLVLVGVSGAGKGTQSKILCKKYNIAHISTGDILRKHVKDKTEIGLKVKSIIESGELVPDDLVIKLIELRLKEIDCKNGFILDGFPRTIEQAKKLFKVVKLDKVIYIKVDENKIIERLSGRLTCSNCGKMYHKIYNRPKLENICDICKTKLILREDDNIETIKKRLKNFHKLTEPIIDFYKNKKLLVEVSGVGSIEEITNFIIEAIEE